MSQNIEKSEHPFDEKPPGKCCSNARDYFAEYCNNTSLHGFKYLGERRRSRIERLVWFLMITIAISSVCFLISQTYQKWQYSPVLVSFAQTQTPSWAIPFPAVTICSETKFKKSNLSFTDLYHKFDNSTLTENESTEFGLMSLFCHNTQLLHYEGNETISKATLKYLIDRHLPIPHHCYEFHFDTKPQHISGKFTPILTDQGVCYSFNILDRRELFTEEVDNFKNFGMHSENITGWSLETGYFEKFSKTAYPRRSWSAGAKAGLSLILTMQIEEHDYLCNGPISGFRVMLHNPGEVPLASLQYIRIPADQEVSIAVKPSLTQTSNGLRSYSPHKRQCYFQGERKLRYFKNYTQQNCEFECVTNATLDICGCVKFSMPHNSTTPICGPGKIECIIKTQDGILANTFENLGVGLKKVNYRKQCHCLQSCASLKYSAETNQNDFEWVPYFRKLFNSNDTIFERKGVRMFKLNIYYEDMQFISTKRHEVYGIIDFLASCGGIFGLFTGFSLLSLMEIFYYLSLRPLCNKCLFRKCLLSAENES